LQPLRHQPPQVRKMTRINKQSSDDGRIALLEAHVRALEATVTELMLQMRELASHSGQRRPVEPPQLGVGREEWVAIGIAASRLGRCEDTLKNWIKKHGIGRKFCGRWEVDMVKARALRTGAVS
jgi:hypothetical protein